MTDKDICPKCGSWLVYSSHSILDKWRVYCMNCGLSTKQYNTWKDARAEWDIKGNTDEINN